MKPHVVCATVFTSVLALAAPAFADVPAGYAGTPYKGIATAIPGRVDFENFDVGGYNVGFMTNHHTLGGPVGCSGGDYRTDADQPTMCKTNQGTEVDKLTDGTLYPSAAMPVSYYIGAVRPGDWVQLTVNVKTAGTYKLSSTWASGADQIDVTLFCNGVSKLNYKTTGGNDYHKWSVANLFGEVQLDAGVQVLKFVSNHEHVNADYIQFSLVTPNGLDDGNTGAGGAPGTGGAGTAGSGGAAGAETASGGTAGASVVGGAGDAAGGSSGAASSAAGSSAAGAPVASVAGANSAGASTAIGMGTSAPGEDSGCTIGAPGGPRPLHSILIALVAGALFIVCGRRRRTRM